MGEESSTYTLRRDDSGALKMCAIVMHGAKGELLTGHHPAASVWPAPSVWPAEHLADPRPGQVLGGARADQNQGHPAQDRDPGEHQPPREPLFKHQRAPRSPRSTGTLSCATAPCVTDSRGRTRYQMA